jgi:hypothetical protein
MTNSAIRQIFQQYLNEGFNSREISHIMQAAVMDLELNAVLDKTNADKTNADKIPVVAYPGT